MKRLPRTETLLVFACAGGAAMLGASQFTDIFHLTPPGGEALQAISSKDQHGYATLVLAICSSSASQPATNSSSRSPRWRLPSAA